MTTFLEIVKTRKRVREILYSWIGVAEIAELKQLLLTIDKMLNEYSQYVSKYTKDK